MEPFPHRTDLMRGIPRGRFQGQVHSLTAVHKYLTAVHASMDHSQ